MFDLVADVERYPEFVPYCVGLVITSRRQEAERVQLVADMSVALKAIRESFTTQVTLKPAHNEILVAYLDGPFSHLENRWRFVEAPGGSDVDFYIDYAFRSPMLSLLMGGLFSAVFQRFTGVFEERAHKIYGTALRGPAPNV